MSIWPGKWFMSFKCRYRPQVMVVAVAVEDQVPQDRGEHEGGDDD